MSEQSSDAAVVEQLRSASEAIDTILRLQRYLTAEPGEQLGIGGHSTQSNHCSSASIGCHPAVVKR